MRRRDDWANWLLPSTPVPFPAAATTSVNPGKEGGDHAEKPEQTVAGSADRRAGGSVGDAIKSEDAGCHGQDAIQDLDLRVDVDVRVHLDWWEVAHDCVN